MKVLFLIYSNDVASGGHYHSCDQISRSVTDSIDVSIITIGNNASPVLIDNPQYKGHIQYTGIFSILKLNKSLKEFNRKLNIDVVHCWDATVMNLIYLLPSIWSKKIILSKCGGQNSTREKWQYANSIISFSFENYNWFKIRKSYDVVNLYHIANRTRKLDLLNNARRKERKDVSLFNFVRIARIGISYEKTLFDTFNLIEKLKDKFEINFYVIGKIQNKEVYDKALIYVKDKNLPVKFITDERTNKASNLLYLADCIIGTGRSLMEASSLGIPLLTPVSNANVPILVDAENFSGFFKTNFSERNWANEDVIAENFKKITSLVENHTYAAELGSLSYNFFKEHFGVEHLDKKYLEVYKSAMLNPVSRFKLVRMNFLYIFQTLYLIN